MKPAPSPLNIAQLMSQAAYDVIVIGAGGAGMSAALYAAIAGKSVLLVERTEFLGGTTAWSAATTWIPGTAVGAVTRATSAQAPDTLVQVKQFLDAAVGAASLEQMRQAFIDNGAAAVAQIQAHSSVQYRARSLHPDYMTELAGSTLNGRAIEPEPFDGRLLGNDIRLIRPPIPEFTVLGGMMVDRDNIAALLSLSKSWASFSHAAKIIVRHCIDKVFHPRSTRLVMGNALIGRLLHSLKVRGVDIATHTQVTDFKVQNGVIRGITVQQNGVIKSIATGAVILASGGFNRNPGLRAALLPCVDMAWCVGAPGHTGEALELATGQGAYFGECRYR